MDCTSHHHRFLAHMMWTVDHYRLASRIPLLPQALIRNRCGCGKLQAHRPAFANLLGWPDSPLDGTGNVLSGRSSR